MMGVLQQVSAGVSLEQATVPGLAFMWLHLRYRINRLSKEVHNLKRQ